MITVEVHTPIGNQSNIWQYYWQGYDGVFSLEFVQNLFKKNPDETDFRFNIHCPGGEVAEGFAIYDFLRSSGKNIHMNIEGMCHSMAVTLLLAAPAENRSANPNCRALIHKVQGCAYGSTDDLEAAAAGARKDQETILGIYADRTGQDIEKLRTMMDEQREWTAQELLSLGFISKINSYNTNFKFKIMAKKNLKQRANDFLNSVKNFIAPTANYEFVDDEGNTLFTTEGEDDSLEVGMSASPDGTFTIADGRTVVIAEGVITEIREEDEDVEEVETLKEENTNLRNQLAEAAEIIRAYRKQERSNYTPARRIAPAGGKNEPNPSPAARKNAVREAIKGQKPAK